VARWGRLHRLATPLNFGLRLFFRAFNWGFGHTTNAYTRMVALAVRGSAVILLLYGGLLVLTWYGLCHVADGLHPQQDRGPSLVAVQGPDAASLERTQAPWTALKTSATAPKASITQSRFRVSRSC